MDVPPAAVIVPIDETRHLQVSEAAAQAVRVLAESGTVIIPTDTVYGLAARPDRPDAVAELFALKDRDRTHPLAVLIAEPPRLGEVADLSSLAPDTAEAVRGMTRRCWPGALTVILPRVESCGSFDLGGDPTTIGVRCPRSAVARAIAAAAGPIVATSANRSGEPTPSEASRAAESLAGSVSLVIDAGPCSEPASTVIDATCLPFVIIRQGSVTRQDLGLDANWVADSTPGGFRG